MVWKTILQLRNRRPNAARSGTAPRIVTVLLATLLVHASLARADEQSAEQPDEVWSGVLKAGPQEIKVQFRVFDTDGERAAKLDVISQGANDIPATISVDGDQVKFEIELIASTFEGTLNENRDKIQGHWNQNGVRLPLEVSRVAEAQTDDDVWKSRPQYPKPPFPYESREVQCENTQDGVRLAGTLTIPKQGNRHPAVILISGSGPQDRDETLLGHKPFAVIADYLSRQGIAVLRMDDRGVGQSSGQFRGATTEDFTRDIEAGVDFLKSIDAIDPSKIGLAGHSEGGLIAPIIAARRDDVAFIVLLAGPGIPGAEIVRRQSELISRAEGIPEAMIQLNRQFMEKGLEAVRNSTSEEDVNDRIAAAVDELISTMPEAQRNMLEPAKEQIVGGLQALTDPWFKYFMEYDPKPALRNVRCPVLAVIGEKDLQVPADVNLEAIRSALTEAGNDDFEVTKLSGLNHLFQTAGTGSPSEYAQIDETVSPVALEKLADWINARMK